MKTKSFLKQKYKLNKEFKTDTLTEMHRKINRRYNKKLIDTYKEIRRKFYEENKPIPIIDRYSFDVMLSYSNEIERRFKAIKNRI